MKASPIIYFSSTYYGVAGPALIYSGFAAPTPAPVPTIDNGVAGVIGAAIGAIVVLVGHFVTAKKNRNEEKATVQVGFQSLVGGLQEQINVMKKDVEGLHLEVKALKDRNSELQLDNYKLRAEVQTKDEVIRGFSRWQKLWEGWFQRLSQALTTEVLDDIGPVPDYTWQMKEFMREVEPDAKNSIHLPRDTDQ